jgi:hypothetical protein
MYNSIRFATLQLHSANETEASTIYKTKAIYENDYFIIHQSEIIKFYNSNHEVKKIIRDKSRKVKGDYPEVLEKFIWHLN